jgi:hypothetical protein
MQLETYNITGLDITKSLLKKLKDFYEKEEDQIGYLYEITDGEFSGYYVLHNNKDGNNKVEIIFDVNQLEFQLEFHIENIARLIVEIVNTVTYGFSINFDIINDHYTVLINGSSIVVTDNNPLNALIEALIIFLEA